MSQSTNNYIADDIYASQEAFPLFNQQLVEPLQIGGLGVQLINFYYSDTPRERNSSPKSNPKLPEGFTIKEFHSPKEPEEPQEEGLETGYVPYSELSR